MPIGTRKTCPNGSTTSRLLNERPITYFTAEDPRISSITADQSAACDANNFQRRSSSQQSFRQSLAPISIPTPMFSVQKFFSQDAKFFDLLEASADQTRALSRLLTDLIKDRSHPHPLHDFALARDKDKQITEKISQELVNTFITGLEREDIETLSYSMYRICKVIEKFAERYNLAPQRLVG